MLVSIWLEFFYVIFLLGSKMNENVEENKNC